MVTFVVWGVLVAAAVLLGVIASCFSLRALRWASAFTALFMAGAITRYGFIHPATRNPDLASAFTSGADKLVQAFLQPFWPGHQVPAPGLVGWCVIAFLLLMGYRVTWPRCGCTP